MTSAEILKLNNIRPSVIRIMIYDYLCSVKSHPTVDEIYTELLPTVPTLSKTTVYNTVKLFTESGLSKVITIDGSQTRYDADTMMHGHFLCSKCGRVYDFNLETVCEKELKGFEVSSREVYYSGVCRECNKNN